MSEPAAGEDDPGAEPAPWLVFTAEQLSVQLGRLRRRQARTLQRRPASLDSLARQTSIPRSTLHTYLTGASLPPPAALDAMVIALGCTRTEVRAWATALDRVVELHRGSGARGAVTPSSQFSQIDTEVRRQLTRPTDQWFDRVDHVAVFEQVRVGEQRQMAALRLSTTVRAQVTGVDRYALRLVPNASIDPDALQVTDLVNCTAGDHRTLADLGVRVLEVVFDHALSGGETYVFELTVDYSDATRQGVQPLPIDQALHGFRRRGPMFTMEVRFPPGDLPADVRQVHLAHPEATENRLGSLRLNHWNAAHISVPEPVAGLHGIRWRWPTDQARPLSS